MVKGLADVSISDIKLSKKILKAMAVLGITQEDLEAIKGLKEIIEEIKEYKEILKRTNTNEQNNINNKKKSVGEVMQNFMTDEIDFDPTK